MALLVCCSRVAPKLLVHVSLLLAIISGAGLATLARLKWDPSTYLVLRSVLPTEYHVLSGVLCCGTFMLIMLAHLAVIAMSIRSGSYQKMRQALFFTYAALMTALIIVELSTITWLLVRVVNWLQTTEADNIIKLLRDIENLGSGVQKFIEYAANVTKLHILEKLLKSMDEIKEDLPYNIYVAIIFVGVVAILQPVAVVLAFNAAYTYSKSGDSTKVVHTIRYNSSMKKNISPTGFSNEKEFKLKDNYLSAIKP